MVHFLDVNYIIDTVLGEFLDPKSVATFAQTSKQSTAETRLWSTSATRLRKSWRTLGPLDRMKDLEAMKVLSVPWRVCDYRWREIDLRREVWGGQAPQVFWLDGSRVLCIAGAVYPDEIGGAELLALHNMYIIDTATGEVEEVQPQGPAHPQMMGCGATFDRERQQVICFGGGPPHDPFTCSDCTSIYDLEMRRWRKIKIKGEVPKKRQGFHATVYEGRCYIFGGRQFGGTCVNDMWALDLETYEWIEITTNGTPPLPRVWYGACHAPYGEWNIIGGSLWEFRTPNAEHVKAYKDLYTFHFSTHTWERIETPTSPGWTTAPCLVPLGSTQLAFFGGCKVPKIDLRRLNRHNQMGVMRKWYPSITENLRVFDRRTREWYQPNGDRCEDAEDTDGEPDSQVEVDEGDMLRRSHFTAAAICGELRNKIVMYGGSRYFTGDYYHDLFVFDDSAEPTKEYTDAEMQLRGQLGRLRALVRHGHLRQEQFNEILRGLQERN